jgi:DNA-binding transcriptional LysR family regulator
MFIRQFEFLEALAREEHFRRAAAFRQVSRPTPSARTAFVSTPQK